VKLSEQIEKHVSEVTYMSTVCKRMGKSDTPVHEKSRHNQNGGCGPNIKNHEEVTTTDGHEAARKKRMQELMRQFGTILKQVTTFLAMHFFNPFGATKVDGSEWVNFLTSPLLLGYEIH
jgi:hypothetical protein